MPKTPTAFPTMFPAPLPPLTVKWWIRNMGAYMRKMALNGYVLHVDLSPVRELVSLQRRCSNNLNQVAIQANTYGGIYPEEIAALQRDYAALWGPLSDLLKKLSALVEL